jgi:tryptophan halogenase
VLLGQRQFPRSHDPLASGFDPAQSRSFLASIREVIEKTALAMPRHQDFIGRHCAAPKL